MDFSWNDIYQDFLNSKTRKCSEREYQSCISLVFRHYLRWQNSIVAEECIHIGATSSIRPDFVLYKDGIPQVVIETKEPNHIQTERNKDQLFSYMRQKKVDFGLYIGEVIQLYYDEPTNVELPLLIFTLEYNKEDEYGSAFVNLFNFVDFDKDRLTEYCSNRLRAIQKRRHMQQDIQLLVSDVGVTVCESLLKSHLISNGYSETDAEMLLDGIEIVLRRKCDNVLTSAFIDDRKEVSNYISVKVEDRTPKQRQKYTVNGRGEYWKNESALELVKAYLSDHPSTYQSIVSIFNRNIPNYVLSIEEVGRKERGSSDKSIEKRWHRDSPLVSSDGITFYVTTQLGDGCRNDFKEIVSLSERLGYKIEPK